MFDLNIKFEHEHKGIDLYDAEAYAAAQEALANMNDLLGIGE